MIFLTLRSYTTDINLFLIFSFPRCKIYLDIFIISVAVVWYSCTVIWPRVFSPPGSGSPCWRPSSCSPPRGPSSTITTPRGTSPSTNGSTSPTPSFRLQRKSEMRLSRCWRAWCVPLSVQLSPWSWQREAKNLYNSKFVKLHITVKPNCKVQSILIWTFYSDK